MPAKALSFHAEAHHTVGSRSSSGATPAKKSKKSGANKKSSSMTTTAGEGLAAVALYRDPDPYIPMAEKLEEFFVHRIFTKK